MSLVYISPSVHETWSPLDQHARGRDLEGGSSWDISKNEMSPNGYPEEFLPDARKFDCGGSKAISMLLPMIRAALEEVVEIDPIEAQQKLKTLIEPLLFSMLESGEYEITKGPHAWHIVGLRPRDQTPTEMLSLVKSLQEKRIFTAVRCGALRVSTYLTNTKSDIDRLIKELSVP